MAETGVLAELLPEATGGCDCLEAGDSCAENYDCGGPDRAGSRCHHRKNSRKPRRSFENHLIAGKRSLRREHIH